MTGFPHLFRCMNVWWSSVVVFSLCVYLRICVFLSLLALSLLSNAFSAMRNPWFKTCALLLGTQIFFGSAMSPREKHRNKQNNRNKKLPPVSVPDGEHLLGALLDSCLWSGLVSVRRGQVSHSNPCASSTMHKGRGNSSPGEHSLHSKSVLSSAGEGEKFPSA